MTRSRGDVQDQLLFFRTEQGGKTFARVGNSVFELGKDGKFHELEQVSNTGEAGKWGALRLNDFWHQPEAPAQSWLTLTQFTLKDCMIQFSHMLNLIVLRLPNGGEETCTVFKPSGTVEFAYLN